MSFSWDETLPTVRDRVRQRIDDTIENEGPTPTGANYSDVNMDAVLVIESGNEDLTVLYYYRLLLSAWTQAAQSETEDNTSINTLQVADKYRALIKDLKNEIGFVEPLPFNGVIQVTKTDRYSNA